MNFDISIAFFGTILFTFLLRHLAVRLGLIDRPGGRKQHHTAVPVIGGIAMFLSFLFSILTLPISLQPYRVFLAAVGLIVIIGILDDFHEISALLKLIMQLFTALIVVCIGKNIIYNLGALLPGTVINLHYLGIPFTLIAIIGIINATNMIDGVDGLAGGVILIQFVSLLFLTIHTYRIEDMQLLRIFIALLLGFLLLNYRFPWRKHALVFMGDAGSMFLGLSLVWFCIRLSQGKFSAAHPVVFLYIMVVPLFDLSAVVLRRIAKKTSPFVAGRDHIHYVLIDLGLSVWQVTLIFYLFSIIMSITGILLSAFGIADSILLAIIIIAFVIYVILLNYLLTQLRISN